MQYLIGYITDMISDTIEQTKLVVDSTSRMLERPDLFDPIREREILMGELDIALSNFQQDKTRMIYYVQRQ